MNQCCFIMNTFGLRKIIYEITDQFDTIDEKLMLCMPLFKQECKTALLTQKIKIKIDNTYMQIFHSILFIYQYHLTHRLALQEDIAQLLDDVLGDIFLKINDTKYYSIFFLKRIIKSIREIRVHKIQNKKAIIMKCSNILKEQIKNSDNIEQQIIRRHLLH